jgi:phospholipid transport system transporter-binding protein
MHSTRDLPRRADEVEVTERAVSAALIQAEGVSVIRLDGAIDIAIAAELKASLLAALESGGEIEISLDAATEVDVTAIQLLWAAEQDAKRAGLSFRFSGELGKPIRSSLEGMGLGAIAIG